MMASLLKRVPEVPDLWQNNPRGGTVLERRRSLPQAQKPQA